MKKVVGITGGIASGKSTVCQYLISLGYVVIDSDVISKALSQKGKPIYSAILEGFGPAYFLPNLELDRKKLGRYIFENPEAREKLNRITHPLIVEEMKNLIQKTEENLIFLDIPLLFEAKLSYLCDTIVCVYVDKATQLKRLIHRDGISKEYALAKIASQMSLDEKKSQSDFVIESKESFSETKENVKKILKLIKGE
ncbi:MAG: dephospho-CoA kinase [Anaeroplasmataceae bacterium]|nr:dephospho-CoA kinase [Anaeroplasmataceae bacterium]MDE6414196.1 dephospho-CoA kinase [Anaeroplasmataceae bacterium]